MSQQSTIRLDNQRLGPSRDHGLEAFLEVLTVFGPYQRFQREAHRLSDQWREPVVPALGPAVVDHDVLAFDVIELPQPITKGGSQVRLKRSRGIAEVHDPVDLPRLLRLNGQRTGEKADRDAGD